MNKYEIMLLLKASLSVENADKKADQLIASFKKANNLKETKWGLKPMAYAIKGCKQAYYYIYNFEIENKQLLKEFRRIAQIDENVLRFLIINIEKNYGYRATINEKKVNKSKIKEKIYLEKQKKLESLLAFKRDAKNSKSASETKTEISKNENDAGVKENE